MPKLALYLIGLTLLAACFTDAKADSNIIENDFRKTRWGMTRAEVLASEDKAPESDEEKVVGFPPEQLVSCKAQPFYYFVENTLVRAGYLIIEKHSEANLYLSDFESISEALQSKYGKPKDSGDRWRTTHPSGDRGLALITGELTRTEIWETDRMTIIHSVMGDNYKASHVIQYKSRQHEALLKADKKDTEQDRL